MSQPYIFVTGLILVVVFAIIGISPAAMLGWLGGIATTTTLLIWGFTSRHNRAERHGVVLHPGSEAAFSSGLEALAIVTILAQVIWPEMIQWIFWASMVQFLANWTILE